MISVDQLNPAQQAAVAHGTGPCLCIAGAGSGKTAVLTLRIARLVEAGVPPEQILAVTFTKKAAGEMQDRVRDLVGDGPAEAMTISTLHSVGYLILRETWIRRGQRWAVLGPAQQKRLVRDILAAPTAANRLGINWQVDLAQALARLQRWKADLITVADYRQMADGEPDGDRWYELYRRYEAAKDRDRWVDFGDMLLMPVVWLRDHWDDRAAWAARWPWILVDEAQDLNTAQWALVDLLAGGTPPNIFAVGDNWQAIMGFQGARPDYFVTLKDRWPGCRVIILDTNYRSRPYIVETGNRVIQPDPGPIPKTVTAARPPGPHHLQVFPVDDERDEAGTVVQLLQAAQADGLPWRELAVLYRTNAQSRAVEEALVRAQIPYRIVGATGFYRRREVQDLLAYLRVTHDPTDVEAFSRAVMAPSRYLGHAFVREVQAEAGRGGDLVLAMGRLRPRVKPFQRPGLDELLDLWGQLGDLTRPADMLALVRDVTDYDAWFTRDDTDADLDDRLGNITALEQAAAGFRDLPSFLRHVDQMLATPTDDDPAADRVTCSTIHRAKGLEWAGVVVIGMAQGLLPHRMSLGHPDHLAEERRLAYVAVTRARDLLWITAPALYQGRALTPSPYLADMGVLLTPPDQEEETVHESRP